MFDLFSAIWEYVRHKEGVVSEFRMGRLSPGEILWAVVWRLAWYGFLLFGALCFLVDYFMKASDTSLMAAGSFAAWPAVALIYYAIAIRRALDERAQERRERAEAVAEAERKRLEWEAGEPERRRKEMEYQDQRRQREAEEAAAKAVRALALRHQQDMEAAKEQEIQDLKDYEVKLKVRAREVELQEKMVRLQERQVMLEERKVRLQCLYEERDRVKDDQEQYDRIQDEIDRIRREAGWDKK